MYVIFDFIINQLEEFNYAILSKDIENYIKILRSRTFSDRFENDTVLLFWMFSLLAFFFLDGNEKEYSIFAFLKGLESIFIVKSSRSIIILIIKNNYK